MPPSRKSPRLHRPDLPGPGVEAKRPQQWVPGHRSRMSARVRVAWAARRHDQVTQLRTTRARGRSGAPGPAGRPHRCSGDLSPGGPARTSGSPGGREARSSRLGHPADPRGTSPGHYGSGVLTLVRQLWRLPAPADARPAGPARPRAGRRRGQCSRSWRCVLRPDMAGAGCRWGVPGVAADAARAPHPPDRDGHGLRGDGAGCSCVASWTTDGPPPDDLNTAVVALLIPYSLARWAIGPDAVMGLSLFLLVAGTSLVSQDLPAGDRIGGTAVVVAAVAVGAAMRTRSMLRTRQLDDVRRHERERLARDLHDTVAHHLTAIAISAQAGPRGGGDAARGRRGRPAPHRRGGHPHARRDTQGACGCCAPRTRRRDRPLDDLAALATDDGHGPRVEVVVADELDDLSPTVAAALQRIAQEAVANARRHARGASRVQVRVEAAARTTGRAHRDRRRTAHHRRRRRATASSG